MNKKKIELQVLNISNSQAQVGAYALVLGEAGGERQLPIIIRCHRSTSYGHRDERYCTAPSADALTYLLPFLRCWV